MVSAQNAASVGISLVGRDRTAQAFDAVRKRAAAATAGFRRMALAAGAALAGLGAAAKVKSGVDELSRLSDIAQQAGVSTNFITRFETMAKVVGLVGVNAETVAKSMAKMAAATGREGEAGFRSALESVAACSDEMQRVTELTRIFGRAGTAYLPIVRAGADGVAAALDGVAGMVTGVADAAADAGDAAADSLALCADQIRQDWLNALGGVAGWLQGEWGVDVRGAFLAAYEHAKYYASYFSRFFEVLGENAAAGIGNIRIRLTAIVDTFGETWRLRLEEIWERVKVLGRSLAAFGTELVSMIRGDGFDIDRMAARVDDARLRAIRREIDSITAAASEGIEKIDWGGVFAPANYADLDERLEARMDAIRKGAASVGAAAVGATVDQTAEKTAKKVRAAAAKAANDFAEAGSLKALKMLRETGGGIPAAAQEAAPAPSARPTGQGADGGILADLREAVRYLARIDSALSSIGTV